MLVASSPPPFYFPLDASSPCTTMNIRSLSFHPCIPTPFFNRLWALTLPDLFLGPRHQLSSPHMTITFFQAPFSRARISWGARNFSALKTAHTLFTSHNLPYRLSDDFVPSPHLKTLHTLLYHLATSHHSSRGCSNLRNLFKLIKSSKNLQKSASSCIFD